MKLRRTFQANEAALLFNFILGFLSILISILALCAYLWRSLKILPRIICLLESFLFQMPYSILTPHDLNVLEKIKDPESAPSVPLLIDSTLPRDPHVTGTAEYEKIAAVEAQTITEFQQLEARIAVCELNNGPSQSQILADYDTCINKLADLISLHPRYASAYNNLAQALRRKYGESVLLKQTHPLPSLAATSPSEDQEKDITSAVTTILFSLNKAITLLTPPTPFSPISPQAAKTLSQAHTQRGALYHITAKQMHSNPEATLRVESPQWTVTDLEEMASRDFMIGGKYGNHIARGLAVATNPTAKLCGSIVQEAMRKEFGRLAA